jgi:FMN phosphatase YigB (HAD superfamily)
MSAVLCLDFDGVLCDSVDECFIVGYNSYFDSDIAAPSAAPQLMYRFFVEHRYLVAPPEDYFLLFHAFASGIKQLDRMSFARLQASSTAAGRTDFIARFFAWRSAKKQDAAPWLALHRLYPQSRMVLEQEFPGFYIVTTKDRDSVERLASHHAYRHKILGIYSRETSSDKRVLFQHLLADAAINPHDQRVVFVDDNRMHLEQVKPLGIETRLAAWGYTDPEIEKEFGVIQTLNEWMW